MASCTIGFYQTDITPEKNALVENIGQYLTSCTKKYLFNVQYFKHDLETTLKLSDTDLGTNATQNIVDTLSTYNYLGVANDGTDSKGFYYFITGTKWISEKAIQLELKMDTINTFQDDIIGHFTEKTKIQRQHKDRFVKKVNPISSTNYQLERLIDRLEEGINPQLYLKNKVAPLSENNRWLLMYIQDNNSQTLASDTYVYAIPKNGVYVSNGGLTYLFGENAIDRAGNEILRLIELPYEPFGVHIVDSVLPSVPTGWEIHVVGSSDKGFTYTGGNVLRLLLASADAQGHLITANLNRPFHTQLGSYQFNESIIEIDMSSQTAQTYPEVYLSTFNKNPEVESKLYHSDFHEINFVYDSYKHPVRLEDFEPPSSATDLVNKKGENIDFYPSNNMACDLLFKFTPTGSTTYHYLTDYEEYLHSNRNLEPMRISSYWIDYMRNGYNYDMKAHNIETTANLINFGLKQTQSAIGIISNAVGGNSQQAISGGINFLSNAVSQLEKEMLYENSKQQKLAQIAAQGANVSGANDLSLLNEYNGNKLLLTRYEPTDRMKELLFDLFYFGGYRSEVEQIPDLHTRRLFNFIQCDPVFNTENEVGFAKYLKDVKERFNLGVTIFHKCAIKVQGAETQVKWDLTYNGKENWETWICPSIITMS